MPKRSISLIIHDVRSTHNVGSMLRTAEGLGVDNVYITGYSPYPETKNDKRLPHIRKRATDQISKTALGADRTLHWQHHPDAPALIKRLRSGGSVVVALEQAPKSQPLNTYTPPSDVTLLVGNEVDGLSQELLQIVDLCIEIPMLGSKESYNVAVATAMAIYQLRFAGD